MKLTYYLDDQPNWFKNWCIRNYGPKTTIEFDVIDSKDSTKLTSFTLVFNGNNTQYEVTANNNIKLAVPEQGTFTIQIKDCEGYVDGVANTYTAALLNGSHIGMTRQQGVNDAEFKLDWSIDIASDLDSHMTIRQNDNEIGHVFYGNETYIDSTTSVKLDIDNVRRSDQKPPEIISIENINNDYTYYYYVDDYSTTGQLPKSNLNLNVVMKNKTVDPAIAIPTGDNPNRYWNVCKIQNGQIIRASDVLAQTVTDQPNTTY